MFLFLINRWTLELKYNEVICQTMSQLLIPETSCGCDG